MSNFKFSCPSCGQKILGHTSFSGSEISCPTCQKTLTVPQREVATVVATSAPQSLASTIPLPGLQATGPLRKTQSRLAIASLVCALVPVVGSLPGIVCGHLALSRIRRDPSLKGIGMATAGLVIGYFLLTAAIVYAVVKRLF